MLQKLSFTFHHYQFIAKKTYPDYTRDALAPYLLHSQVPLTEESTALIRSKYIPGVTETGHNTMKKIKESLQYCDLLA